jgi:hypothetical protein
MFSGYMAINGTEIINSARTKAYADAHLPGISVKCSHPALRTALTHNPYTSPQGDAAPWYNALRPSSSRFYGFVPVKIEGAEDSTQKIETQELLRDGAVHVSPRYEAREIRVVVVGLAEDDEALADGFAWLKDVLENAGCRDGFDCVGREVNMFHAAPSTTADAFSLHRTFYGVSVEKGPRVTKELPSKVGAMKQYEFILSAGIPWAFTDLTLTHTLLMNTATNYTDPVGEDCSLDDDATDNFINDPFFTGISPAPQPPNILPPNILDLTSWRRLTAPIGAALTTRPGRVAPVVTVVSGAAPAQYIRLRFYPSAEGVSGCDYVGEFFISYIPASSTMVIDAIRKEVSVTLPDGRRLPGGHLLYGSAGRPFMWPDMSCKDTYTMTADMFPGQTGISVELEVAVRE